MGEIVELKARLQGMGKRVEGEHLKMSAHIEFWFLPGVGHCF